MSAGPRRARVGRPRARGPAADDVTPREEVLAAAAALFTQHGYAATTTRAVAERAGMRQASLYHWFAGKEDILATLLEGTVAPSLDLARVLLSSGERHPGARLWALVRFDAELLSGGLYNLGALYQLPEVAGERFASFRDTRRELCLAYRELLASVPASAELPGEALALRADVVFGLVEGTVAVARETPGREPAEVALAAADAALRVAGCTPAGVRDARAEGGRLLAARAGAPGPAPGREPGRTPG